MKECCGSDNYLSTSLVPATVIITIEERPEWQRHWSLLLALVIIIPLLTLEHQFNLNLPPVYALVINAFAYFLAGWNVLLLAFRKLIKGEIVSALKRGKITLNIVWQNYIVLAISLKILVLSLGAFGKENLREALMADVVVAILAILDAVRTQKNEGVNFK